MQCRCIKSKTYIQRGVKSQQKKKPLICNAQLSQVFFPLFRSPHTPLNGKYVLIICCIIHLSSAMKQAGPDEATVGNLAHIWGMEESSSEQTKLRSSSGRFKRLWIQFSRASGGFAPSRVDCRVLLGACLKPCQCSPHVIPTLICESAATLAAAADCMHHLIPSRPE